MVWAWKKSLSVENGSDVEKESECRNVSMLAFLGVVSNLANIYLIMDCHGQRWYKRHIDITLSLNGSSHYNFS